MEKFSVNKVCFPIEYSKKGWIVKERIGGISEFGEIHRVCRNNLCEYVLKCQIINNDDPDFLSTEEANNEIKCHTAAANIGLAPEIIDSWFTPEGCAIIMRVLKETLHNRLLNINSVDEGKKLLDDTLYAISELHRNGIFHGDTHLQNIMLTHDDKISFIDFGFSVCDKITKRDKLEDYFKFKQQLEDFFGMYIRNRTNPQSKRDIFMKLQRLYTNSSDGKIIKVIRDL